MEATKLSLKLLVDKNANKVLFAEAGKDFVDFLFSLLSLPVGTVIRLVTNATVLGCIGNLYESLDRLSETYMQPNQTKDAILHPFVLMQSTDVPLMLTNPNDKKMKFYTCSICYNYVADRAGVTCYQCRSEILSRQLRFISPSNPGAVTKNEGGIVKGLVTYLVADDLSVSPLSMISGVALLNKFNVKDLGALQEMIVEVGIEEGLELLRASLQSKAAFTNVFLEPKDIKIDPMPEDISSRAFLSMLATGTASDDMATDGNCASAREEVSYLSLWLRSVYRPDLSW